MILIRMFIYLLFTTPLFAMEWTGDVLLKNVFNNTNKAVSVEIERDNKIITHADFEQNTNVPQPWVTRLQSQKNAKPDKIIVKPLGFIHIPTGLIKEIDLIIKDDGVKVIPAGTKKEVRAEEDRALAIKGLMRKNIFSTITIKDIENNSTFHAVFIMKDANRNSITNAAPSIDVDVAPKSTKQLNLTSDVGKEIFVETRQNKNDERLYTYLLDGKFEYLRILIDAQGVVTIAEAVNTTPRRAADIPRR